MIHEVSIAMSGHKITAIVYLGHIGGSMSSKTDDGIQNEKAKRERERNRERERERKVNRKFIVLLVIHPRQAKLSLWV